MSNGLRGMAPRLTSRASVALLQPCFNRQLLPSQGAGLNGTIETRSIHHTNLASTPHKSRPTNSSQQQVIISLRAADGAAKLGTQQPEPALNVISRVKAQTLLSAGERRSSKMFSSIADGVQKSPRSSDLARRDASLICLFLAASLHLWDVLPSECWHIHCFCMHRLLSVLENC